MDAGTKHIILGAGGAIGTVLMSELLAHGEKVKLVSRRGVSATGVESMQRRSD